MLNKPSWKIIIFMSMNVVQSLSQLVMWKILIYNLLWLAEYQCKAGFPTDVENIWGGGSWKVDGGA